MKAKIFFSLILTAIFVAGITRTGISQDRFTKNFQVKKGERLSVKVSGDVRVESWSKDEVLVEVSGLDAVDRNDLKITQDGNTVSVSLRNDHNASFSIKTPGQFNFDIKTSGGDLSCLGEFYGSIKGSTAGGDIKVESINGNVELVTAGGDINTGNINGDLKVTTAGGDIRVGIVNGEGKMATAGGDITVTSSSKSLNVNTAGGDIKVGNVGGEIKASTSGGDIEVGLVSGIAKLNTSGGDIKLAGAKGSASVNTSGGDIKLENIYGFVKANTSGGRIYAELTPDGSDESKLSSSGGTITFLIPENAKATIEAVIKADNLKGPWIITSEYKTFKYGTDEDSKEIRATIILNGGGKLIKLTTSNSKIEIKKLNK
ncbi:MAG: hypothetical protein COZ80_08820 [Ignavibacteria bacterium CG_4_8_14_3_um_filter_37_9]|nr:DUF4097 domain-containing protein [Ignavibacteria bacterium]OIO17776.1 MAG: hypothetical protein AUJ54_09365 [Ignavibacteria bacterium CG1_02_37_35]PIW98773.1 MAG: hypothetical protein COZ80_08820 [Ignavibacteria bacterium CG_4_8_14_3_um_filter_37_9]PIX93693.1 MAG: hypothetical protein COZ25_09385 [Ignavibacteria bacterium CG_4_10_14_3_um_filter_37_18]PJC59612.1 MAG: hypothetical protein CO025_05680 [Ignavibacteria bacterium CG_4_9_14_0_2_um_filter_37_13]